MAFAHLMKNINYVSSKIKKIYFGYHNVDENLVLFHHTHCEIISLKLKTLFH